MFAPRQLFLTLLITVALFGSVLFSLTILFATNARIRKYRLCYYMCMYAVCVFCGKFYCFYSYGIVVVVI